MPIFKRQSRGGIERKFITSIVWVGVIPMVLALASGYVLARENQKNAVRRNLETASRLKAESVRLTLHTRLQRTRLAAHDPELARALALASDPQARNQLGDVLSRLKASVSAEGGLRSDFAAYTRTGEFIASTRANARHQNHPEWEAGLTDAQPAGFDYEQHILRIAAPVREPGAVRPLGFLVEDQDVRDALRILLHEFGPRESAGDETEHYEVLARDPAGEYRSYYIAEQRDTRDPSTLSRLADRELARQLNAFPRLESGALIINDFAGPAGAIPAVVAYHRIHENYPIYLVAYRSAFDVYESINVAALLTLVLSSLIIGLFCVIAYRNVHNNVIRPVSLLNEGAQIIRQGDLELKLVIGTGDEIEELAMSFNKMASALRTNINQLEESEERYRNLITSMRDGIYQTNTEGNITLINPAGVHILGHKSAPAVVGSNIRVLFLDRLDYARVTRELERHRFVERMRVWMKRADERTICVELAANQVYDENGAFVGIEGTFRDVTQNVVLEQEARERSERIAAINQIANTINSSLEAGRVYESIVVEVRKLINFDYAEVVLFSSEDDSMERHQLWPEAAGGGASADYAGVEPQSALWVAREKKVLCLDDLRAGTSPFEREFPKEIRSCLCLPLYATERIIGTLKLGAREVGAFGKHEIEISEQMTPHVAVAIRNAQLLENLQHSLEEVTLARERLHEMNDELKTLDELKTNLLSNVSHELRTPLVAVMGYTDMILNGKVGPINDVQTEYLGISLRNIEKLVTLIENLLDFSRLHRGAEELVFDTFDMVDCARTSMQIIKPVSDSRDIRLDLVAEEQPVLVEGDKGKLGQVFNNLLSNAVKFNDAGGTVTVSIRIDGSQVTVSVSDTGIGIPGEALDKIFTRFYQYDASSTRKYGGTGIGLAIAQDIMRLHGSRITVTSEVGKGATFTFSLPLSMAQDPDRASAGPNPPLPTETHLLVELVTQDRALSAQIRNLLLSEGMDVIHAAYPSVARSLAEKYSPDVLLVDTEAGPLGTVVVEEILKDPSSIPVPIILLTNDEDLYEKYESQVAARIRRGFRKSTLLSGIHYALSHGVSGFEELGDKVLCVDDDEEIGIFIARCLENEGFETEQCKSGEEALERVANGDFWLVLLDIAMPGMDGWETCRRIKSNSAISGIKIYMVTAKPIDKSLAQLHECGADGYLMKPFKADDLVGLVQSYRPRKRAVGPAESG
ncbi:MAG: response regulator [Candidatus Hydrogenedentes bacterium]|nr:response regulator [Candidatus Hydrogenedentota bacterium]